MITIQKSMISRVMPVQKNVLRFVASDESVDRDGDIIMQDGWDLSAFQKNPVFLWNHRSWDQSAIGKVVHHELYGGRLEVVVEFVDASIDPFAGMIYEKYVSGFLNAVSVGFTPVEFEEFGHGYKFKKVALNEISGVNVPANANAVQIGHSSTPVETKLLKRYSGGGTEAQEFHQDAKVLSDDVEFSKVDAMVKIAMASAEIQKIKNRRGL